MLYDVRRGRESMRLEECGHEAREIRRRGQWMVVDD
jgi:hypothetical protein